MNNIEYYNLLSVVSLAMFVVLTVMAIIMWFKLDIRHYIAVLTGSEARRNIDRIKKDAASGEVQTDRRRKNKAVVSWNASEETAGAKVDYSRNVPASSAKDMAYDPDKTVVLGQPDPYATMVLSEIDRQASMETTLLTQGPEEAQSAMQPSASVQPSAPVQPSASVQPAAPGFVVEKDIKKVSQ